MINIDSLLRKYPQALKYQSKEDYEADIWIELEKAKIKDAPYQYRIARNVILHKFQKNQPKVGLSDIYYSKQSPSIDSLIMKEFISNLNHEEILCLNLRSNGDTLQNIAEKMGCTIYKVNLLVNNLKTKAGEYLDGI